MAYIFKGFATYPRFVDNQPNIIHPFGEISAQSMTYVRDRDIYSGGTNDKITLYTYISTDNNVDVDVNSARQDIIFKVTQDIYLKSINAASQIFADEIIQDLFIKYGTIATGFQVGEMVTDGTYWMPTYVTWKDITETDSYKVWFSDQSFRNQFPDYTITAVAPIPVENIDIFVTGTEAQVKAILESNGIPIISDRVEAAKNNQPSTANPWMTYPWYYPKDPTRTLMTTWSALVYGLAGNNPDAINDALAEHILENSQYDRDVWKEIFPDIFKRNEFILVPQWDKYAIEQRITIAGTYSPVIRFNDYYVNYMKDYTVRYPRGHVELYATGVAHQWKSIQLYVVGGNENRDNKFLITDHFPDFIAVNTQSEDFNKQKEKTRFFSEFLLEMLMIAETMTEFSDINVKYKRVWRDGKMFLTYSYERVNYIMAAKYNFL